MELYIKNMVCSRCIIVVRAELEKLGLSPLSVQLGEVELGEEIGLTKMEAINTGLLKVGFSIINDPKTRLVEQIKHVLLQRIQSLDRNQKKNLSLLLSDALHRDYSYISHTFSEMEGATIEHYFIAQKIEKAKELLSYGELSLDQIADRLLYSSASHLSKQFKKSTGQNPTEFKQFRYRMDRRPIEQL